MVAPGITLRPLQPSDDIEELTGLLHRAYATLAGRGMRYLASHQDSATTRRRLEGGEAFVAVDPAGALIGTIVWYPPGSDDDGSYYSRPGVASFGQFGVDPAHRGKGLGRALHELVETRAREAGARQIACDTADIAGDLIEMYQGWGYRIVGTADYRPNTNYTSVILAKDL